MDRRATGQSLHEWRRGRHRLQPQPPDRLFGFGVLDDVAEDQFSFAAGVAGVDQLIDVFPLDQSGQDPQPAFGLLDGPEIEMRWNHRKTFEGPFATHGFDALGCDELEQMTDGGRHYELIVLVKIVLLLEASECLGDIASNGRLLCNDQGLAH